MNEKTTTYSGGVSASSLLGIAFVCLKLHHDIDWSWWWVLAPFWMPILLFFAIVAAVILVPFGLAGIYMVVAGIISLFDKFRK